MIFLILYIQVTYGNSNIYEDIGEIYWPAMNIEEVQEEVKELIEEKREPASEEKKYKSIEELQNLVDSCWYRCTFE